MGGHILIFLLLFVARIDTGHQLSIMEINDEDYRQLRDYRRRQVRFA